MTVRFNTPVTIGETRFPAGETEIQVLRTSADNVVLVVRAQDAPSISVPVTRVNELDIDASARASVILERRGDTYRLDRILFPDRTGYRLNPVE